MTVTIQFRDNWRLSENFVAAEGEAIVERKNICRTDLVSCYLSLILSRFIDVGILEVRKRTISVIS